MPCINTLLSKKAVGFNERKVRKKNPTNNKNSELLFTTFINKCLKHFTDLKYHVPKSPDLMGSWGSKSLILKGQVIIIMGTNSEDNEKFFYNDRSIKYVYFSMIIGFQNNKFIKKLLYF